MQIINLKQKVNARLTKKNIYIGIILLMVFLAAYYIRAQGARFNEMPDIDTWYFYRLSETFLKTGQLITIDYMRNYPFGIDASANDGFMPIYFPVFIYLLGGGWGLSFFHFALIFPAFFGSISVILMFFLGREFLGNKTGLLASFFLATLPAYITRTAAGEYEKEAVASVFIILFFYFFIKSYKTSNWKYSIFSGISLFLVAQTWGGSRYFALLLAAFVLLLGLLNKDVKHLIKIYAPIVIIGIIPNNFLPYDVFHYSSSGFLITGGVLLILVIKYGIERFKLVGTQNIKYIIPGICVIGAFVFLIGGMFYDPLSSILNNIISYTTQRLGVEGQTVAENAPGSFDYIQSQTDLRFNSILPQWNWIFIIISPWILSILGLLLSTYLIYRTKDLFLVFPLLWFITSVWGALALVRLSFVLGPPYALLSAIFLAFSINTLQKLDIIKKAPIVLIIIVVFILGINLISGISYGSILTPSICIPNSQILINGQKCLETDSQGNIIKYAEGQPWYSALNFMKDKTPKTAVMTSWWDFGYWFQARAERPTITDGGMGLRYETALWFVDDYRNWNQSFAWMKERNVSHILMDWTLIGKYGAISFIASKGKQTDGFLQFTNNPNQPTNVYNQNNRTIVEYKAGAYTVWIPFENSSFVGAPLFFISQGNQASNQIYIDEICTSNGIQKFNIPNNGQDMGGCVSFSQQGVYYIPENLKDKIFTRLMFMDGSDLPVKKVFDNGNIQIYEVE